MAKVKDPVTGQFKTLYVKALDSMPVGTEVDFDGTSADIPTGWEQVASYSTNEVKTGDTWIDGKPIYRKVIQTTTPNTADVWTHISINIQNVDTVVSFKGNLYRTEYVNQVPFDENTNSYVYTSISIPNQDIAIKVGVNLLNLPIIYILEYTKTTD